MAHRMTPLSIGVHHDRPRVSEVSADLAWHGLSVPCQNACPAGTDIPGYLEAIYQERFADAYRINLRDNIFPAVLGRVCARPCERACRHGAPGNGDPVAICFSKRAAADFDAGERVVLDALFRSSRKRVVVIGSGPAGLAAARELVRFGHSVTVLERHRRPGGMLTQGIPVFRLPRDIVMREIDQITAMGVDIQCGISVGSDVRLEALARDYDAVVLAAGTARPNRLTLPGANLDGVEHGLQFLCNVNESSRTSIGQRAVIIGGGYSAMDCARTALRLGASSTVHYRRGREDMVILPGELEELLTEGGKLYERSAPLRFSGIGGLLNAMQVVRTRPGEKGRDGRFTAIAIPDSVVEVAVDSIILATGQFPETSWIDASLQPQLVGVDGWLSSGKSVATGLANIFVAGDFALGATTLIQAIGHAKQCARAVDEFLMRTVRIQETLHVQPAFQSKVPQAKTTGRTIAMNFIPIQAMPILPAAERTMAAEVELGYSKPSAVAAASRCYLCHYKFEIDDAKCVLCDECVKVKAVPGCIVEISGTRHDAQGIVRHDAFLTGQGPSLYYSRLWIDQTQCVRCGACEAACPVNAITIQKVSKGFDVDTLHALASDHLERS